MAVLRLLPRAQGNYSFWTLGAGANKVVAVQTNDGGTSFITQTGANQYDSYLCDLCANRMISVSSVDHGMWSDSTTSGTPSGITQMLRYSGTDTNLVSPTQTTSYANYTATRGTNPIGGAWTPAIVDLTEIGVRGSTVDDAPVFNVTMLYMDATGVLVSGIFTFFVGHWLGPLVAVGLHEIPRLVADLCRRSGGLIRIQESEHVDFWRELREHRHPKYYFRPASGLYLPEAA